MGLVTTARGGNTHTKHTIIIIEKREGKNLKNDLMDCFVEKGGGGGEEVRIIVLAVSFDVLSRLYYTPKSRVLASRVFSLSW